MTNLEKEWQDRLRALGCVMCRHFDLKQTTRTTLHHMREGQGRGQRADTYMEIPLCVDHHQGNIGWHGLGKSMFYTRYKMDELDLLALALRLVHESGERSARWMS